jgi:hypothetical protein
MKTQFFNVTNGLVISEVNEPLYITKDALVTAGQQTWQVFATPSIDLDRNVISVALWRNPMADKE